MNKSKDPILSSYIRSEQVTSLAESYELAPILYDMIIKDPSMDPSKMFEDPRFTLQQIDPQLKNKINEYLTKFIKEKITTKETNVGIDFKLSFDQEANFRYNGSCDGVYYYFKHNVYGLPNPALTIKVYIADVNVKIKNVIPKYKSTLYHELVHAEQVLKVFISKFNKDLLEYTDDMPFKCSELSIIGNNYSSHKFEPYHYENSRVEIAAFAKQAGNRISEVVNKALSNEMVPFLDTLAYGKEGDDYVDKARAYLSDLSNEQYKKEYIRELILNLERYPNIIHDQILRGFIYVIKDTKWKHKFYKLVAEELYNNII